MNSTTAYIIVCMLLLSALMSLIILMLMVSEQPNWLLPEQPARRFFEFNYKEKLNDEKETNKEATTWLNKSPVTSNSNNMRYDGIQILSIDDVNKKLFGGNSSANVFNNIMLNKSSTISAVTILTENSVVSNTTSSSIDNSDFKFADKPDISFITTPTTQIKLIKNESDSQKSFETFNRSKNSTTQNFIITNFANEKINMNKPTVSFTNNENLADELPIVNDSTLTAKNVNQIDQIPSHFVISVGAMESKSFSINEKNSLNNLPINKLASFGKGVDNERNIINEENATTKALKSSDETAIQMRLNRPKNIVKPVENIFNELKETTTINIISSIAAIEISNKPLHKDAFTLDVERIRLQEIFSGRETNQDANEMKTDNSSSAISNNKIGKILSILLDSHNLLNQSSLIYLPKNNGRIAVAQWNWMNGGKLNTINVIKTHLKQIHRLKLISYKDIIWNEVESQPRFIAIDGDRLKRLVLLNQQGEMLEPINVKISSNTGAKDLCVDKNQVFVLSRQALNGSSEIFVYDLPKLRLLRRVALRTPSGENCNFIEALNEFVFVSCQSAVLKFNTMDTVMPIMPIKKFAAPEGSYSLAIQLLQDSGNLLAAQRGRSELHLFDENARFKIRLVNFLDAENASPAIFTSLAVVRSTMTTIFALEYITNKIHVFNVNSQLE